MFKPGHYWDCREARWVRCDAAEAVVPTPSEPGDEQVEPVAEADAPAG